MRSGKPAAFSIFPCIFPVNPVLDLSEPAHDEGRGRVEHELQRQMIEKQFCRWPGSLFVEPRASLVVVRTEVDDIDDVFGGAVDFEDETSVSGRLGLRLGREFTASNQLIYSSDVTASVWQEFSGDNDATIAVPLFAATTVSDDPGETFGDVAHGFSVQSPEGWSSFLRANYQFSEDYDAFAGNVGLRFAW